MAEDQGSEGRSRGKGTPRRLDYTGQKYGRLTAVRFSRMRGRHNYWWFLCDCGNGKEARVGLVRAGDIKSCGCLCRETSSAFARTGNPRRTHGMVRTPEYRAWGGLHERCRYPGRHPNYGGRGIKVCAGWVSFKNFLADMGTKPSPRHSVGRIDNDGDYTPQNCEWQEGPEQIRNRRNTRWLTLDGRTLCLTDWAVEVGLSKNRLTERLNYGWPVDLAIRTPPGIIPPDLEARRLPIKPALLLLVNARNAVINALRNGSLVKPATCQYPGCAEVQVQAHHHKGYARAHWGEVIWLCRKHHGLTRRLGRRKGS